MGGVYMNVIEQMKKIINEFQMAEVNGVMVDVQTANLIVSVYNALSEETREKFASEPIERIITIAWKLVN